MWESYVLFNSVNGYLRSIVNGYKSSKNRVDTTSIPASMMTTRFFMRIVRVGSAMLEEDVGYDSYLVSVVMLEHVGSVTGWIFLFLGWITTKSVLDYV